MSAEDVIGDEVDEESWKKRWVDGRTAWHRSDTHEYLTQFFPEILKELKSDSVRVFVPLCGKSLDMIYFHKLGHSVEGIDLSDIPLKALFTEYKLEMVEEEGEAGARVFRTPDSRFKLTCGDYFQFKAAEPFDFIWDRASLVAINVLDRPRYAAKLREVLRTGGKILLNTLEYDPLRYPGPPHYVTDEAVKRLFRDGWEVRLLEEHNVEDKKALERFNVDWWKERAYLITKT